MPANTVGLITTLSRREMEIQNLLKLWKIWSIRKLILVIPFDPAWEHIQVFFFFNLSGTTTLKVLGFIKVWETVLTRLRSWLKLTLMYFKFNSCSRWWAFCTRYVSYHLYTFSHFAIWRNMVIFDICIWSMRTSKLTALIYILEYQNVLLKWPLTSEPNTIGVQGSLHMQREVIDMITHVLHIYACPDMPRASCMVTSPSPA